MKILIELIFFFKIPLPKRVLGIALKLGGGGEHNLPTDGFADECRDLGIK